MQCNRDNALTASASCGDDGEKRRVQLFLSVHAKGQLDRLARQRRYTGNGPDRGMGFAEWRATARLSGKALKTYHDG